MTTRHGLRAAARIVKAMERERSAVVWRHPYYAVLRQELRAVRRTLLVEARKASRLYGVGCRSCGSAQENCDSCGEPFEYWQRQAEAMRARA